MDAAVSSGGAGLRSASPSLQRLKRPQFPSSSSSSSVSAKD